MKDYLRWEIISPNLIVTVKYYFKILVLITSEVWADSGINYVTVNYSENNITSYVVLNKIYYSLIKYLKRFL